VYLKRLELLGFKSFPDKTVIKLIPGVTVIVGPNGCGKTNILDSIRWVLGEQKVSLLRGTKMEEIIFNGTRDLKPLGMAEVTLVIQNNKGILPTEYSEVQITRRLFRSGESEYLLNKIPCRLKDIADLLMDTGIGAHVYSVIQQDMIDAILSDRAEERRFLFEEAAGISKYKNRKKAALRKLEATEQDLLRLKDIVAEVNTQVNSLGRQMKKAERYQKIADELKEWELYLNKSSIENFKTEKRALTTKRENLLDIKLKCDAEIDSHSARQEEDRKLSTDLDRQLAEIGTQIYEKSEAGHLLEKDISVFRQKRENARQLKEKNSLDIEAFGKRKAILFEQIESATSEMTMVDGELIQLQNEVSASEKMLNEADDEVLSSRKTKDELSQQMMTLERQLSAGMSDDTNLKEQESELKNKLVEIDLTLNEAANRKMSLQTKLSRLNEKLAVLVEQSSSLRRHATEIESLISEENAKSEELSGEIIELSASLEAAEARRHLLMEMITHYDGYGSGVVATFENKDNWPDLIGTVADNITPKSSYEDAIEAAIGELAGFIICRNRKTASDIIEYLRREKKGKAGLIVLESAGQDSLLVRPEINSPSFIGWADEFISVSEEMNPLVHLLLSRTAVVANGNIDDVLAHLPQFYSAVTIDGRLHHSKAIMTGGSNEGLSLFGRREKVTEQEKILSDISEKLRALKEFRNKVTTQLAENQAELRELNFRLEQVADQIDTNEKEITSATYELQSAENDIRRIEKEQKTFAEKLEILKGRQYSLTLNYDQLAQEKGGLMEQMDRQNRDINLRETTSEQIQKRLSLVQINLIENKSKKQQLESNIRHTEELISEIESTISQKLVEITNAEIEINSGLDSIERMEKELKEAFDARSLLSEKQYALRQSHDEILLRINNSEKDIKNSRHSKDSTINELHTIELRMTEIEAENRAVIEKIRNEYDIDLENITAPPPDASIPSEKQLERMHELKETMRNFGGVNLLALEEFKTYKERQEFLTTQLNDLLSAKSTLQSTITKINVTARNLFLSTFDEVRKNFQKVFEELFTGGEADIRLFEEDDPLESPIEIIARPRGKKLLSIAQMSGGERALTAISLLFAIYLVKPSPFCILDEIDAPLDDANIHRFLKMIKAFSDQTQFIIITHNKITMEAADVLYGITMEQPGISRVVSVRFNEEPEGGLINTSIDNASTPQDTELPPSIKNRLSSDVTIDSSTNIDDN
jgi:chromosome segregation protein